MGRGEMHAQCTIRLSGLAVRRTDTRRGGAAHRRIHGTARIRQPVDFTRWPHLVGFETNAVRSGGYACKDAGHLYLHGGAYRMVRAAVMPSAQVVPERKSGLLQLGGAGHATMNMLFYPVAWRKGNEFAMPGRIHAARTRPSAIDSAGPASLARELRTWTCMWPEARGRPWVFAGAGERSVWPRTSWRAAPHTGAGWRTISTVVDHPFRGVGARIWRADRYPRGDEPSVAGHSS